ncbi:MAG: hypothetical protein NUW01_10250, partial [Gemmatimonadaceae bacterium]|nr:hypothetical protein [Gemmatimonadaceae bacterium]
MRVVFLNGPPGCGKDTAARFAVERFGGVHLSVAAPVKRAVHELLAVPAEFVAELEHTSALKDVASPWFFGQTPRQAYIAMTETLACALAALHKEGPFVLMLRGRHLVRETS